MARAPLPPHLAHKSALAIVLKPEDSFIAYEAIQSIRDGHDKAYERWPPHINLLYPFLKHPSARIDSIVDRIQEAVQGIPPISAKFTSLGEFVHSKKSATIFLEPDEATMKWLRELQAALQAAFPECNYDTRPFTPHLTLGQAPGPDAIGDLADAFEQTIMEVVDKYADEVEPSSSEESAWTLEWHMGLVTVLERTDEYDPFEAVGYVALKR